MRAHFWRVAALALVPSWVAAQDAVPDAVPGEDGPPSVIEPLILPASHLAPLELRSLWQEAGAASEITPAGGESAFGAAPGASAFSEIAMEDGQRDRAEEILTSLGATRSGSSLIITLPGDVLFDFDRSVIRSDARPALQQLAEVLQAIRGAKVGIFGHTDSKGSDAYNLALSERRAGAVRDWLAMVGISEAAMSVAGRGENEPVAPNSKPDGSDDPEGRQLNRRVEFVITQP